MQQAETIVLLLGLVAALVVISQKIQLPYSVVLVLAGLALSFVPHLPEVKLNADVVFYFFLPALIYPERLQQEALNAERQTMRSVASSATSIWRKRA